MKNLIFCLVLMAVSTAAFSQQYFTKEGKISFVSDAPLEKIEGINNAVSSVVDVATGKMEFAALIKAFKFEKSLMEEHFNENYMESSKFPKATFKGAITDLTKVDFKKDGVYSVTVKGDLTIHGVTKNVTAPGKFVVKSGAISASSSFTVLVADYQIKIPSLVKDNVAKEVKIEVSVNYQLLKS